MTVVDARGGSEPLDVVAVVVADSGNDAFDDVDALDEHAVTAAANTTTIKIGEHRRSVNITDSIQRGPSPQASIGVSNNVASPQ